MALADLAPGEHADRVRDHWWWRPGWRVGRRFYAFHVTFEHQPRLHRMAGTYRTALAELPGLTLVPDRWLHLTMQGVGFRDELSPEAVERIAGEARSALATVPAFDVGFNEVIVADEAIAMLAWPTEPVRELRHLVRQSIGRVLGDSQVTEPADRFRPHVSVAYSTAEGPATRYVETVTAVDAERATARISQVDLIEMHRDQQMYEWRTAATLPLGATPE